MATASSIPLTDVITLPPLSVLRLFSYDLPNTFVSYSDDQTAVIAESVFNPRTKIAVETAQKAESGKTYVNLRFCYSNRYIGRSEDSVVPIAELTQPDEDTTKTTSTLFELTYLFDSTDMYYFCHVQSGTHLMMNEANDTLEISNVKDDPSSCFQIVDWQSLVNLPPRVAFKGANGSYLKGYTFNGHPYLQFSSVDPNSEESVYEVEMQNDGFVKIKYPHFSSQYWRNSLSWIWADWLDSSTTDTSNIYWPVKVDDATIALRSVLNNNFCANLTADGLDDCLNANSPNITTDSHLVVHELVSDRKISQVVYRMADARIFNEQPYSAGSTTADNETDEEASIFVSLQYTYSQSYSFSNSTSLTAGVSATIEADLLDIVKGSIETSVQVSQSLEWGQTITTQITVTAQGNVTVPAKTSAIVYYVGTLGTCDVPFSYTRQDTSSTDGSITYTSEDDGIYTGVNAYNFSFQFENPTPDSAFN